MDILGFRKAWNDITNYRDWIKTIQIEEANPKSVFNKFNMGRNAFYNIYVILTLNEEDKHLPEGIQRLRVTESIVPINRYLDETLKFAEHLAPEFSRIFDGDEPTLNYLIVYSFAFNKLSIKWVLSRLVLVGGAGIGLSMAPWQNILTWISNLI